MAGDTTITVIGNMVEDPELRFTPSGAAVAKFRIASTPRYLDKKTGEWKDGDALFLSCNAWRQMGENIAESLQRGARVIVSGRLRQRSYETREGEKRTVYELEVDEVGASLKYATVQVRKLSRSSSGGDSGNSGGGFGSSGGSQPAAPTAEPWDTGGDTHDDPWATSSTPATAAPAAGGAATGGFEDEPPF